MDLSLQFTTALSRQSEMCIGNHTGTLVTTEPESDRRQATYQFLFRNERGLDIAMFNTANDIFYTIIAMHGVSFELSRPYSSHTKDMPSSKRDTPWTTEFTKAWYLEAAECRVDPFFEKLFAAIGQLPKRDHTKARDVYKLERNEVPQFTNYAIGIPYLDARDSLFPFKFPPSWNNGDDSFFRNKREQYVDLIECAPGFSAVYDKLQSLDTKNLNSAAEVRKNPVVRYKDLAKLICQANLEGNYLPASAINDWLVLSKSPKLFGQLLLQELKKLS